MYYYLLSSLKRRLILELKDSFSRHPVYEKIVPFIQTKYAFTERPQFGIVVKGSSANKVQLSAENFMGTVSSHVMLAYLNTPSYMIEWVREDLNHVQQNGGVMPTAPGVYYMECLTAPTNPNETGTFVIDPLLTVTDEPVLKFNSGIEEEAQLQNLPAEGTVRLWEQRKHLLIENHDYILDYTTGQIRFKTRFAPNAIVTADYRYAVTSIGPVEFNWNTSDHKTLPGVVLAFGKRAKVGDKVAIVIYDDRVDTANAFGGRFEASFDLDVISMDPIQMEEIADFVVMSIWGEKRAVLASEGIEILDVSIGGETEETYDETADQFFYNASLSIQIQADWEIHIPLPFTISKATMTSAAAELMVDADRLTTAASNLTPLSQAGMFFATSPIIVGRNNFYERIT